MEIAECESALGRFWDRDWLTDSVSLALLLIFFCVNRVGVIDQQSAGDDQIGIRTVHVHAC